MVESAIVLGVMGIVLAAVWVTLGPVRENIRQEDAVQQIATVVKNTRAFYQGQASISGNFDGLRPVGLTNSLIYNGAIPNDMIRSRTASPVVVDHPWGPSGAGANGSFVMRAEPDRQSFRIRLRGLSLASCIAMAMKIAPKSSLPGFTSTIVNDVLMPLPVTVTAASAACTNNANVDYVFRLRQ